MRRTPPTWHEVTPEPGFLPIYKFEEGYFRGARHRTSYTSIAKGKQRRRGRLAEAKGERVGAWGVSVSFPLSRIWAHFRCRIGAFPPLSPFVCPVRPLRLVKLAPGYGDAIVGILQFSLLLPAVFFLF